MRGKRPAPLSLRSFRASSNQSEDDADKPGEASTSEANESSSEEDPDWTRDQDRLLRSMKESNPPLPSSEIAKTLGKSRMEVYARWKQIQNLPAKKAQTQPKTTSSLESDTDGNSAHVDDESKSDSGQESGEEDEEVEADTESENDDNVDGESDQDSDADSDSDQDKDQVSDSDEEEDQETTLKAKGKSPVHNKWHTGIRNNKIAAENKKAKASAKAKTSQQDDQSSSGQDASSESSDVESHSQNTTHDPDKRREMRKLQAHVYKQLYPAEIHPEPDDNFDKKDCELLGAIHSRNKMNRWLEMQINFYNVTGRLIPLEVIQAKCERAEAEEEARCAKKAADREEEDRHKVEAWMQDVHDEDEEEESEESESEESEDEDEEDSEEDSQDDEEDSDDDSDDSDD